jgi:hypothetical protein
MPLLRLESERFVALAQASSATQLELELPVFRERCPPVIPQVLVVPRFSQQLCLSRCSLIDERKTKKLLEIKCKILSTKTRSSGIIGDLISQIYNMSIISLEDQGVASFVVGVVIGLVLTSVVFSVVSSSVNTVLVCVASSPVDFERNHP